MGKGCSGGNADAITGRSTCAGAGAEAPDELTASKFTTANWAGLRRAAERNRSSSFFDGRYSPFLLKASATTTCVPGKKTTRKSKSSNVFCHLRTRAESFVVQVKFSRFLWSEKNRVGNMVARSQGRQYSRASLMTNSFGVFSRRRGQSTRKWSGEPQTRQRLLSRRYCSRACRAVGDSPRAGRPGSEVRAGFGSGGARSEPGEWGSRVRGWMAMIGQGGGCSIGRVPR